MATDKTPQLERLNTQLRDIGRPPERDLWQGIEEAITKEEKRLLQRPGKPLSSFWRSRVLWAAAAMVAFAIVLIPTAFQSVGSFRVSPIEEQVKAKGLALKESESTLSSALKSLEAAVRENPGDQNLSRLVHMLHSRKGELLRHKWSENNRVQGYLNGGV